MPASRRPRTRLLAVVGVAALVAVGTAGCGTAGIGSPTAASSVPATNGLERKTAAQVQRAAAAALKSAGSIHLVGSGQVDGGRARMDFRIQGSSATGTIAMKGATFRMTVIGRTVYLKGDRRAWQRMGTPAAALGPLAGRWVKTAGAPVDTPDLTIAAISKALTHNDSPLLPAVKQTSLNGRRVVVISQRNGSKLYVSNTGRADALHLVEVTDGGRYDLTEHGRKIRITAPSNPLDIAKLR